MCLGRAAARRRRKTNDRTAADQCGPRHFRLCGANGDGNFIAVLTIDFANHLPTVGFKTFRCVVGKPALDLAIDGNTILVIKANQLTQPQCAGE